jgi:hypothetical protein
VLYHYSTTIYQSLFWDFLSWQELESKQCPWHAEASVVPLCCHDTCDHTLYGIFSSSASGRSWNKTIKIGMLRQELYHNATMIYQPLLCHFLSWQELESNQRPWHAEASVVPLFYHLLPPFTRFSPGRSWNKNIDLGMLRQVFYHYSTTIYQLLFWHFLSQQELVSNN